MPDHILLIGMMGAGKTTVGELLADRIGARYLDSDDQIVARTGRTVREIFERDGEPAFRALESDVLREALACEERSVVSVAGGAVLDPTNRERLRRSGVVVWLRAPVDVLATRVRAGDHRPLLGDDPTGHLERLYSQREPIYAELADVVVDVTHRSPAEAVDAIVEAIA